MKGKKKPVLLRRVSPSLTGSMALAVLVLLVVPALTRQLPASWLTGDVERARTDDRRVLLVDDDGDGPDVRMRYTRPLEELGRAYEVWDMSERGVGPMSDDLATFEVVIWFTGASSTPDTGPSPATSAALAAWLHGGRLLVISSQDYSWAHQGPTELMRVMGVASVDNDRGSAYEVVGGGVLEGLGPLRLEYDFEDFADAVEPGAGARSALQTERGTSVAVLNTPRDSATLYLGFPLEAIAAEQDRRDLLEKILELPGTLIFEDGFETGDTSRWSVVVPPPNYTPTPTVTGPTPTIPQPTPTIPAPTPTIPAPAPPAP